MKDKKFPIRLILLFLLAAALRFSTGFLLNSMADVVICPIMGIFAGLPGIIGCAIGGFIFGLVNGNGLAFSALFTIPTIVAAVLPFIGRRFLKDKSKFSNAWIFFATCAVTSIAAEIFWLIFYSVRGSHFSSLDIIKTLTITFICISFAICYPVYFLIASIKERNFKNGSPLLNAYIIWLPVQLILCIFFAMKVYSVNMKADMLPIDILDDWLLICFYMLIMEVAALVFATLTNKHKRVMLFVFAIILSAASVYNIITFDTGEGVYILIFITLWLLLHACFFNWYEEKALKAKGVKIASTVLHYVFLITLILIVALDTAAYIIPKAKGNENNVIVLGAPVQDNKASGILEERIDVASDYLNSNRDAFAILTGGTKVEGGKTEAEVIRDGLVSKGISGDRLVLESSAKTTQENFEKSLAIIRQKGGTADDEIVIITSSFHLLRSGIYARRAGFNNLTYRGAISFIFKDWVWYLREVYSILPLLFS